MSTKPEALRLADALDAEFVQGRINNSTGRESAVELRRLHEALETQQEPVAWMHNFIEGNVITHIPADIGRHPERWTPLYTTPPKREWVGLTEKEWYAATGIPRNATLPMHMLKGIEKALKEKNG